MIRSEREHFLNAAVIYGLMLLACHLFIGAIIGYAVFRWKGNALAIPVAMVAALLPDLVDKPLGHLFLQDTLDNGRIFAHSLLFLGLLAAASLAVRKKYGPLVIALLAGVVSHLLLDSMWSNPTTLFWPLLGPFVQDHYPDYFGNAVVAELSAPSEYAFMLGVAVIVAAVWGDRLGPRLRSMGDILLRHRRIVYGLMLLVGAWYLIIAIAGGMGSQNEMILAIALIVGGSLLHRLDPGRTRTSLAIDG